MLPMKRSPAAQPHVIRDLTLDKLQHHFEYGLKEAATRLGVCTTTLKRVCRWTHLLACLPARLDIRLSMSATN